MGNKSGVAPHSSSLIIVQLLVVAVVYCLLFLMTCPIPERALWFFSRILCSFFSPLLHSSHLLLGGTEIATNLKCMISSPYNPREDKRQFTSEEESRRSCLIGKDGFVLGFKMEMTLLLIQEEFL